MATELPEEAVPTGPVGISPDTSGQARSRRGDQSHVAASN